MRLAPLILAIAGRNGRKAASCANARSWITSEKSLVLACARTETAGMTASSTFPPDTAAGTDPTPDDLPLHLLRLISPSLPVGAFSYSRGLEGALAAGWVSTPQTACDWILGVLETSFAALDGAWFWRMMLALRAGDLAGFHRADAWLAASRESLELQLEDRRMAEALMRLLTDLGLPHAPETGTHFSDQSLREKEKTEGVAGMFRATPSIDPLPAHPAPAWSGTGVRSYPAAFALAAHHWGIAARPALKGLIWSVLEAQVAAAIRLVPLGHTAGQRILIAAVPVVARAAHHARTLSDDEIGNAGPALAMASAWHETQYSRLFRS